eukprot:3405925-Pleurochrysis_carterae.AAC.1
MSVYESLIEGGLCSWVGVWWTDHQRERVRYLCALDLHSWTGRYKHSGWHALQYSFSSFRRAVESFSFCDGWTSDAS